MAGMNLANAANTGVATTICHARAGFAWIAFFVTGNSDGPNSNTAHVPSATPSTDAAKPSSTALPRNNPAIRPPPLPSARRMPISCRRSRTLITASSATQTALTTSTDGSTAALTFSRVCRCLARASASVRFCTTCTSGKMPPISFRKMASGS